MIGDFAEAVSEIGLGFISQEEIACSEEKLRKREEEGRKERIKDLKSSLEILKIKRDEAAEAWDFFNLEKIDKEIENIKTQLKELCVV